MNNFLKPMLRAPSVHADVFDPRCSVCGISGHVRGIESHHVVFRSQGGAAGPVIDLCSAGGNILRDSNGMVACHGAAHHHLLHFRYEGGRWEYLRTDEPTKYERALAMDGWRPLAVYGTPSDLPF